MVLSAQAMRDLTALDAEGTLAGLSAVCQKTVKVAIRVLEAVLEEPVLNSLRRGFHNNQFVMICHAVAEIVQVRVPILNKSESGLYASMVLIYWLSLGY